MQVALILTCPCTWAAITPGVLATRRLDLESEEVVLHSDCCLGCHTVTRMPYGELGNVSQTKMCCCTGFSSGLISITPGNCCETSLVGAVVRELQDRMKARGDTGNIKRTEENALQLSHLHAKVDAVMAHLQIAAVPAPMEMKERM